MICQVWRWFLAVMAAVTVVCAGGALAEGWTVVRDPVYGWPPDFGYVNKRLIGLPFAALLVAFYFLVTYGAARLIWRRRWSTLDLAGVCRRGALAGGLPGLPLLLIGEPILALISVTMGAGVFGLLRTILPARVEDAWEARARKHLAVSVIAGAVFGAAFTAWVFHAHLWIRPEGDFYVAAGVIDYLAVGMAVLHWFLAAMGVGVSVYWLCFMVCRTSASLLHRLCVQHENASSRNG